MAKPKRSKRPTVPTSTPPITRLGQVLAQRDMTADDLCAEYKDLTGDVLSKRQVYRWLAGDIKTLPFPRTQIALSRIFAESIDVLFGPPSSGGDDTGREDIGAESVGNPASGSVRESDDSVDPLTLLAAQSSEFLSWAESSNVGDLTVEQIQFDIRELSRAYLKVETAPILARTIALRDRLFELLQGRQRPSQTRDLYDAAGWTLTLLAWITVDLGRPMDAGTHLRAATACAGNSGNDLLMAWIGATGHTASFWLDDFEAAARHAELGLRRAPVGSGASLFLSSAVALDLAKLGMRDDADDAIRASQDRADNLRAADSDGFRGPFECGPGRAGGFWADALLSIGRPQDSLRIVDGALDDVGRLASHKRNAGSERMIYCQKVKAELAVGAYDGAHNAMRPILATNVEHRVAPLLRRVSEIASLAYDERESAKLCSEIAQASAEFVRAVPRKEISL